MPNRVIVNKLRDNSELAQAAYGYFHLVEKKFHHKSKTRANQIITQTDILDITYNGYVTSEHTTLINPEKLNGDFAPLQAKRFFERYDLLIHQPNTESDFSNVLSHKGKEHRLLAQWVERTRFKAHRLDFSYKNCNYHTKRMESCEVFITNITHNFTQKGRV